MAKKNLGKRNLSPHPFSDAYHFFLTARWRTLLLILAAACFATNLFFASLYHFAGDVLDGARAGSFRDAFYFSAQTLSTVGYGHLFPKGDFANVVASVESFIGLLGFAMASGLMFAKFSRPTAKVIFSQHAVITIRDGKPSLVFRLANGRSTNIFEARLSVIMARTEFTAEGESVRKMYDLHLHRHQSPLFALTWTVIHPIDEASPFFEQDETALRDAHAEVFLTFVGLEATFSQTVHARHTYKLRDLRWNHRLVDILTLDDEGRAQIDYAHFHDVIPDTPIDLTM